MFNIKVSRRLISFVLVFIMIFSMSSTVVYADSTNSQDGYTTAVEKQAQYQNSISQFHSKFSDKEFGGMYYDDDSVLCINLIESSSKLSEARSYIYTVSQSLKNHKGIQNGIRINYVKYSLYDLRSSVTSITNHMKELGVTGAGVDQRNNQISIYIPKGTQLDEDLIKSLVSVDEQHIKIIENEYVAAFTAGVTVRPGTYGTVGSGSFTMSWGGPLSRNCALREVGLVIPGHAATVGTDVDWNSAHIGTAVWRKLGGNYDIALVERSSTTRHINDSLPDLSNLPIGSPVTYPTVGSTVTAYGGTSKKQTGTIQETDFSWIVEGNLMTGMLRCSYRAIGGDSGAPVFGAAPVGIQSFSLFDTNGNWVTSAAMPLFIVCARLSQTHLFLQEF